MRPISDEELRRLMTSNEKVTVVNVLSSDSFQKEHIPKSVNVPPKK